MSAAEPAHPGPDRNHPGTVIPMHTAGRPSRRQTRRERTTVPRQPDGPLTPHQKLAAALERQFADQGRTLTDDDTAQAFLITVGEFRRMLEGALATGVIGEAEYADLYAMCEGMAAAPGLLTES